MLCVVDKNKCLRKQTVNTQRVLGFGTIFIACWDKNGYRAKMGAASSVKEMRQKYIEGIIQANRFIILNALPSCPHINRPLRKLGKSQSSLQVWFSLLECKTKTVSAAFVTLFATESPSKQTNKIKRFCFALLEGKTFQYLTQFYLSKLVCLTQNAATRPNNINSY